MISTFLRVLLWGEDSSDGFCDSPFFLFHLSRKSLLTSCSSQLQGTLFHFIPFYTIVCLIVVPFHRTAGSLRSGAMHPLFLCFSDSWHKANCLLIQQIYLFFWRCKQDSKNSAFPNLLQSIGGEKEAIVTRCKKCCGRRNIFSEGHSREGLLRQRYLFWNPK